MAKKFPIFPKNPERICWGCDKYCKEDDLQCGNGCERIQHPIELDGRDWYKKRRLEQFVERGAANRTWTEGSAQAGQTAYQTAFEKQNGLNGIL